MNKQEILEDLQLMVRKLNHEIYTLETERSEDGDRVAYYLKTQRDAVKSLIDRIKAEGLQ